MRAGREAEAGRGAGRAELGQVRDAGLGRAGEKWCARGLKGGVRAGPKWARGKGEGLGCWVGLGPDWGERWAAGWVLFWVFCFLLLFYISKSNSNKV